MLSFTEAARDKVLSYATFLERPALRVALREGGSPLAPSYDFLLVEEEDGVADAVVFETDGVRVIVDSASAGRLRGRTIDYRDDGFAIRDPEFTRPPEGEYTDGDLAARVRQVIDERINPGVASHGGSIGLVDVRDNIVFIEMSGGCQGCAMSKMTLRQGVERMVREAIPEIVGVRDVTDHQSGTNPFYASTP